MPQELINLVAITAEEIHTGDPLRRAELEARIRAGQPQRQIAIRMGLPVEVVRRYESSFFNERPQWNRTCVNVTHWRSHNVLDRDDVPRFWLIVAIDYGILALEPFLQCVDHEKLRKRGLMAYLGRNVPLMLKYQLLVAQACCPYLRTKDCFYQVRHLAALPKQRGLLPPGPPSQTLFYARFVSVIRAAVDADAWDGCPHYGTSDRICQQLWGDLLTRS